MVSEVRDPKLRLLWVGVTEVVLRYGIEELNENDKIPEELVPYAMEVMTLMPEVVAVWVF